MFSHPLHIENQYTQPNLFAKILQALAQQGVAPHQITRTHLAAVDEFHVRGHVITREMAAIAGLQPGMQVLDIGCGPGGACRLLAGEFGCMVTGIDITAEYIRTAEQLSLLVGLQHQTRFVQGDALTLPFDDSSFNVVWTQHVQMNIADKQALYAQVSRVLATDGRFIYYDVLQKNNTPLYYPVPWAGSAALNHLITSHQLHQLLVQAGLQRVQVRDETENGMAFLQKALPRLQQKGFPPVGLHLLMGDAALDKLQQLYRNLAEEKVMLECGLYCKRH